MFHFRGLISLKVIEFVVCFGFLKAWLQSLHIEKSPFFKKLDPYIVGNLVSTKKPQSLFTKIRRMNHSATAK